MAYRSHRHCCPPADPIITDPRRIVRNFYHPQLVQVIHPVEVVNRHHCVPVYQHSISYCEKDEFCGSAHPYFRKDNL
ncbi:hypothetical protein SK3146_05132 [Paenibacillus konkukensis]|uniref:Spore coat protein D n=1 Tax=Paenibacillus konkukensis TaxID=2020716 RepID=A0ABY4RTS4_9BACL|nr:hypothetical protein SK3146_05132 [Paenibacillus konkukensis]